MRLGTNFFSQLSKWAISIVLCAFSNFWTTDTSYAQTDTHFWFVAPEVSSNHSDRPIAFRLTSESAAATVRLYTPADPSIFDTTLVLGANATTTIPLTHRIALVENDPANTAHNKGFLIESSALITAYYEVISAGNNPDIFALKGRNALGMEFFIPGQQTMGNSNNRGHERIDIVATEDNTTITLENTAVLFRSPGGNIPAGASTTITLNRGQTYSFRTDSRSPTVSQAGSRVASDKPIAITYIDDSVLGGTFFGGGCFDLLGDQLIPVPLLGNEYIVMRGFLNAVPSGSTNYQEIVIITAVEDSSPVFINGGASIANLMRGETYTHLLGDSSVFIQSTNPISVAHISGFGCETGLAILPSIVCTGSRQVGFTRTTTEFFGINLMTKSPNITGFLWNGGPVVNPNQFQDVPGTNGVWKFTRLIFDITQIPINTGNLITNSLGPFHMGIINGGANTGCRYGYFSDFARYTVEGSTNSPPGAALCEGSTLELYADSIANASYVWTSPAGVPFSSNRNPVIPNLSANDTGAFVVFAIVDGCNSAPDTVWVSMRPLPADPNVRNNGPFCEGDSIRLIADTLPGVLYAWTGPNGFTSTQVRPFVSLASIADTGTYTLTLERDGCTGSPHNTHVVVYAHAAPPVAALVRDSLCPGETAFFNTDSVPGASYHWSGPAGFHANQRNPSLAPVGQANAGWYYLQLSIGGCESVVDSVHLSIVPGPILLSISSGSSSSCYGDTTRLRVDSIPGYQYQWLRNDTLLSGATGSIYSALISGAYRVLANAPQGCSDTSTAIPLVFHQLPPFSLTTHQNPALLCSGDSMLLTGPTGYQYQWLLNQQIVPGATDSILWAKQAGSYTLQIMDTNGCRGISHAVLLQLQPLPQAIITPTDTIDWCTNSSLLLHAQLDSGLQFQWLRNDTLLPDATDSSLAVSSPGAYQLIVSYAGLCGDTSAVTFVRANPIPLPSIQALGNTQRCDGDTLVLRETSQAGQIQWLRNDSLLLGATDSVLRVTQAGFYRALIRNLAGCSDTSAAIQATFHPSPTFSIQLLGSDSLCPGDSSMLRASRLSSYQWLYNNLPLPGATDSFLLVSQAGQYRLLGTNAAACGDTSAPITLYQNPLPQPLITAQGPTVLCAGGSVQLVLQLLPGSPFHWRRNGLPLPDTGQSISVQQSGDYQVFAQNQAGCTDSSNHITVVVNPLPSVAISAPAGTSFCANDSILIRASGDPSYVYQWMRNGQALANANADTVWATLAGNYQIVATDTNSCSTIAGPVNLQQIPLPNSILSSSGPTAFCVGDSLVLSAQPQSGSLYQWFRNGVLLPDTSHRLSITQAGSYRLRTTNALGCTDSSLLTTVTVHPLPSASINPSGPTNLCTGDTLLLNGNTGPFTYQWLANGSPIPGAIQSQLLVSGNGAYQLVVTSATGCRDTSESAILQLLSPPNAQISNDNPLQACPGDSVQLRINNFNPAYSYNWQRNGVPMGQTTELIQVQQSGNYRVQVTDTAGCSSMSNPLQVVVLALPSVNLAAQGPFEICEGTDVELMVQPTLNSTYQWFRDGASLAGANQFNLLVASAGNYHCRVENTGGCANESAVVRVDVLSLPPQPTLSSNGPICAGADLRLESPALPGLGYLWSGPQGFSSTQSNPIRTNTRLQHSGWYRLQLVENGCLGPADSIFVRVEPPLPAIEIQGRTRLCTGNELRFEATDIPGASYVWELPSGDTVSGRILEIKSLWLTDSGQYVLRVQRGGCLADPISLVAMVSDYIFYFPTAFSPNGDGINDEFYPGTFYTGPYDLRIFDRWGQLVFRTTDPLGRWDGRIDGAYAQNGAYNWVLQYEGCRGSRELITGGFMLIR